MEKEIQKVEEAKVLQNLVSNTRNILVFIRCKELFRKLVAVIILSQHPNRRAQGY